VARHTIARTGRGAVTGRLWRLRKDHRFIEAIVRMRTDLGGVDLEIHYNGEATYRRRWASAALAEKDADIRLRDFQRQGWATHW
jgi:hypothetical protein